MAANKNLRQNPIANPGGRAKLCPITMADREDVLFPSGDSACAAWLYHPNKAGARPPVVIMAHGFGAVRSFKLPEFADYFAANGYAVLLFDYRNFGDSPGRPRNYVSPKRHVEDYTSAIRYVRRHPDLDGRRIALWGVSFSGGHSLCAAARDGRVGALLGLVPFVDAWAAADRLKWWQIAAGGVAAGVDTLRGVLGQPPLEIPITGRPGDFAMLTQPGWHETIMENIPADVDWSNSMPARSIAEVAVYRPILWAPLVRSPVQWIYGRYDKGIPYQSVEAAAGRMTNVELHGWNMGHMGPFQGELFQKTLQYQLGFLEKHLATADSYV